MDNKPTITKLQLRKQYKFMYENFVISTQHELYLLLDENNGTVNTLKFDFLIYKYGIPNDEGLGAHPMAKFGLGFYGLYQVDNSPWIVELNEARSIKTYDLFEGCKHYIVTFKDVTLDVISKGFQEANLTTDQVSDLIKLQIGYLADNDL